VAQNGASAEDGFFFAEQNARLVKNAEAYYRSIFRGRVASWNLRDRHMVETLDALVAHQSRRGQPVKTIVWAHNSHLGVGGSKNLKSTMLSGSPSQTMARPGVTSYRFRRTADPAGLLALMTRRIFFRALLCSSAVWSATQSLGTITLKSRMYASAAVNSTQFPVRNPVTTVVFTLP
jgi:hypothetical protein